MEYLSKMMLIVFIVLMFLTVSTALLAVISEPPYFVHGQLCVLWIVFGYISVRFFRLKNWRNY